MKEIEVKTKTPYDFEKVTSKEEVAYHYAEVAMANLIMQLHRQLEINEEMGKEVFTPSDFFDSAVMMLDQYVTIKEA